MRSATRIIALDSGPAGIACNSPSKEGPARLLRWIDSALLVGRTTIILPEVVDYEVRRSLRAANNRAAERRLDGLTRIGGLLVYVPINTVAMRLAADLWAQARQGGYSTAGEKALDGDVILAAQVLTYVGVNDQFWIATDNEADLRRYVGDRAQSWQQIM